MAYYYYPDNLYHAPNSSMNNANALCNNIASYQMNSGSILPFGGAGSSYCGNGYNFSGGYGNFGSFGYGGFGSSLMNTSSTYTKDAQGNITSNFSQHPDYLGIGLGAVGTIANVFGAAKIANTQAQTLQQNQIFQNMAYQEQSNRLDKIQQQQMNQKTMQDTMGMMMNMMVMKKMMGSLSSDEEA